MTPQKQAMPRSQDTASEMQDPIEDDAFRYTIGALAEEFGITTRAIRFYEARGLLSPARVGSNRQYTRRDRGRLSIILRGKNLGFSLEDIADYLQLYDSDPGQIAQTQLLLDKVGAALNDLTRKRADLDRAMRDLKDIRAKCIEHLKTQKT
ncbi:MAG: MerR family DNA-binding transcriptional regulator [Pseudomonadota bacterium]